MVLLDQSLHERLVVRRVATIVGNDVLDGMATKAARVELIQVAQAAIAPGPSARTATATC
jgi:hypothetical protein